ncbi:hypothetical protein [Nonomuraea sp. NPDC049758]|uniref:hypothetical protein n=1 Tax=Nonomuraea sp. NPDC049758 TaxID=3154360 RepID=UPI00342390E0
MQVRMITAALTAAVAVSLAPGVAGISTASAQASPAVTSSVSVSLTSASTAATATAAAKWHFAGVFAVKQACQVAGRYYKAVRYAKDYKCKKILVGPVHRLYILR